MNKEKEIQKKLHKPFGYKSIGNTVKDVDTASRTVVFYASAFDTMDDQQDILRKGCFAKSIKEWGPDASGNRKIKHCLFHDERLLPGAITELSEDNYGLLTAVRMSDTQLGNDTLQYYLDGVYNEHSLRIWYVDGKLKWVSNNNVPEEGYFEVKEVKLWHTATVAFASNEHTPVVGLKSAEETQDTLLKTNRRMSSLLNALKNSRYSEDALKDIAYGIKECQDIYHSLIDAKPAHRSTLLPHEPDTATGAEASIYSIVKSFNIF